MWKSLIILLFFVACRPTHNQKRIYDSTVVLRDSLSTTFYLHDQGTDTVRYRRQEYKMTHTPEWQRHVGITVLIIGGLLLIAELILKIL